MKNLNLIIFFTVFNISYSISCDIITYPYIYLISSNIDKKIIKQSDCSASIQNEFIEQISNSHGKLPVSLIASQLSKQTAVNILPDQIQVTDMKSYLQERVKLSNNRRIVSLNSLTNIRSINSQIPLRPIVECHNCDRIGTRTIKLQVKDKFFWLNLTIKEPKTVWVPINNIAAYSTNLNRNEFISKLIYDQSESKFFYDIKNIQYYKTTQELKAGIPLLASKLAAKQLVRAGKKVVLLLKGKNISLKSSVIANQNGRLGEIIELKNPKSNKKFIAKVIDINTAEVQL